MLNGCCTYLTVDGATHDYRHDCVTPIERAIVTNDEKLVVLVEGARAESSKVRHFTMTVSLPPKENDIRVAKEGMQEGWRMPDEGGAQTLSVTIGPSVVLPAYHSALGNKNKFPPIVGAERTLYLVQHSKHGKETSFYYVNGGAHPRSIEIGFDGRVVKTPQRYPLLLFVPVTLAVDVAIFPIEIVWLETMWGNAPNHVAAIRRH